MAGAGPLNEARLQCRYAIQVTLYTSDISLVTDIERRSGRITGQSGQKGNENGGSCSA
jgi:hypothetical protein